MPAPPSSRRGTCTTPIQSMPSARWPEKAIMLNESTKKLWSRALDKQKVMQGNHLNQQQPWVVQMGCATSIPCKHAAGRWPRAGQALVRNMDDARERIGTAISTALKEIKPISISIT
ncbi:uncharacterized protein [Triticum aestivum]|uniref:uncharacterized protein n=1 Tax=Triticum aestivum TaxID=4565 RepID=UPI001D025FDF|nr:uncharacterized protein LOC123071983 [Triticum aestivum]